MVPLVQSGVDAVAVLVPSALALTHCFRVVVPQLEPVSGLPRQRACNFNRVLDIGAIQVPVLNALLQTELRRKGSLGR